MIWKKNLNHATSVHRKPTIINNTMNSKRTRDGCVTGVVWLISESDTSLCRHNLRMYAKHLEQNLRKQNRLVHVNIRRLRENHEKKILIVSDGLLISWLQRFFCQWQADKPELDKLGKTVFLSESWCGKLDFYRKLSRNEVLKKH